MEERKEQLQIKQATENSLPTEQAVASVPAKLASPPPTEETKPDPESKKRQASTLETKSAKIPKKSTAASSSLAKDVGASSTVSASTSALPPVAARNEATAVPVKKDTLHDAAIKMTLQTHSVQSESPTTIQAGPGCSVG